MGYRDRHTVKVHYLHYLRVFSSDGQRVEVRRELSGEKYHETSYEVRAGQRYWVIRGPKDDLSLWQAEAVQGPFGVGLRPLIAPIKALSASDLRRIDLPAFVISEVEQLLLQPSPHIAGALAHEGR